LNFTAYSYPDSGGVILIAGGIIAMLMLFYEIKYDKKSSIAFNTTSNNPGIHAGDKKSPGLQGFSPKTINCGVGAEAP